MPSNSRFATPDSLTPRDAPAATDTAARTAIRLAITLVILGLALRLYHLGRSSLWLDEAFSVSLASAPWVQFVERLRVREANMGLYYVLLRGWLDLGRGEATVRLLSVVFSVASLPVMYALAARIWNRRTALFTLALAATNVFHVQYAQEARGYSLVVLLVTLSTWTLVAAVERPSRWTWAAWTLASTLAVYTHFYAVLVTAAHVLTLALTRPTGLRWRALATSLVATAVMLIPLALFFATGELSGGVGWIPMPTREAARHYLMDLLGPRAIIVGLIYAALCALGAWQLAVRWRGGASWRDQASTVGRWTDVLIVAWLVVPPATILAASLVRPIVQERYLIISLPPALLLAAATLAGMRRQAVGTTVLGALLILQAAGLARYYEHDAKEDWRAATALVLGKAGPSDAILFYPPYVRRPYDYYRTASGAPSDDPRVAFPSYAYSAFVPRSGPEPTLDSALALASRHRRIWVVLSHDDQDSSTVEAIARALSANRDTVAEWRLRGIRVREYEGRALVPDERHE